MFGTARHHWVFIAAVAGTSVLSGCVRRAFEFQPNSTVSGSILDLTVDRPSEADVLFIVDDSGSMKEHQDNLKRNAGAFITELAKSPNKFQIAVTTTDQLNCSNVPPTPNPWDGKCGRLFSPDGLDPIIRRTDYEGNDQGLIERFQTLIDAVGTTGSGYEQGLKGAATAVDPELTAAGRPNAGFLRPDALLGLVFLSDETDCSYPLDQQTGYSQFIPVNLAPGQSCYEFANKLEAVKTWADKMATVKGRASLVAVGAITAGVGQAAAFAPGQCSIGADGNPTQACSCFYAQPIAYCAYTNPQSTPSGEIAACGAEQGVQETQCCVGDNCCTAMGNNRYSDFADFFRLRYKDSICRNAYDETLRAIANILKRDCFTLAQPPYQNSDSSIIVTRRAAGATDYVPVPKSDNQFDGDGWFYLHDTSTANGEAVDEVCLAGSYKRVIGDSYKISLVSTATGIDSNQPAPAQ